MARRAAVLVSGGGSISPFTTPDAACASGLAAGGTLTAWREGLLAAGVETYTAPATVGAGVADEDSGWAGFAEAPDVLPAEMTLDSVGEVEESATCLARFLIHLRETHDVDEVDFVAHSLGGVFSRSAIMRLREWGSDIRAVSLTTVGTPWLGSFVRHFDAENMPMPEPAASYAASIMGHMRQGGRLVAERDAPPLWAAGKEHALDGIALTRIAGTYFTGDGSPSIYPHDGMASRHSVFAVDADPVVLPASTCHEVPDVHSIYFARIMDLPWETSITWDPAVTDHIIAAVNAS